MINTYNKHKPSMAAESTAKEVNKSHMAFIGQFFRLDLKRQWNSKKRLQKVHGSPQTSFDASAKRSPHSNMSRKTLAAPLTELSARKSSRMAHEQSSEPPSQSPPIPPPLPRVSHSQTPPQQSIASSKELSGSRGGFSPLHPPPPPGSAPYFRVSSSGYTIPDAPAAQPPTPQSQKFRHKSVSFSGREGSRKDAEARVLDFEGSAGDQGDLLS